MLAAGHRGFFTIPHFDGYAAVLIQLEGGRQAAAARRARRRLAGVCPRIARTGVHGAQASAPAGAPVIVLFRRVRSGLEPSQHCPHPAVARRRLLHAELLEDRPDVGLDRLRSDDQLVGDGLVRSSLRHQRQHFPLTDAQRVEHAIVARAGGAVARSPTDRSPTRRTRPARQASTNSSSSLTRSLSR